MLQRTCMKWVRKCICHLCQGLYRAVLQTMKICIFGYTWNSRKCFTKCLSTPNRIKLIVRLDRHKVQVESLKIHFVRIWIAVVSSNLQSQWDMWNQLPASSRYPGRVLLGIALVHRVLDVKGMWSMACQFRYSDGMVASRLREVWSPGPSCIYCCWSVTPNGAGSWAGGGDGWTQQITFAIFSGETIFLWDRKVLSTGKWNDGTTLISSPRAVGNIFQSSTFYHAWNLTGLARFIFAPREILFPKKMACWSMAV